MATTITGDTLTVGSSTIRSTDTFDSSQGVIEEVVTGSTGTAVKFTNGIMYVYLDLNLTLSQTTAVTGYIDYPVPFVSEPFGFSWMQDVFHDDGNYGKAHVWKRNTSLTQFGYRAQNDDGATVSTGVGFAITVVGYWK